MKIRELINEFIPCEICGNNDAKNFYFHVLVDKGYQPYVKCCECEEEYYSTNASKILTILKESRIKNAEPKIVLENKIKIDLIDQKQVHPLVRILSQM